MKIRNVSKALALSMVTFAALPVAVAQVAPEATEATETQNIEEVVVLGIRSSFEAAADLKRNDSRIVDAIVAEDIGKLPDNNIAEALQRITGVSINTDFGVGDSVSIRGLSQNRVELNGRTTTGDDRDGVSLQDFPSSFLTSVEVIKSPTADMIEGALGGTVRMNTVRPLDLDGLTLAGSLDYEYADKTEEWGPIFNAAIGNKWELDSGAQFGATVNISSLDRTIRQDTSLTNIVIFDSSSELGRALGNQLGTSNGPKADAFQVQNENTVEQWLEERERTAANLSLQWAPASGNGNVYLDIGYADRSGSQRGNSILEAAGVTAAGIDSRTTQDRFGVVQNHFNRNTFTIPKAYIEFRETETFSNALGFDFDITDSIALSGEISLATSESSQPDGEFNSRPLNRVRYDQWVNSHTPASFEEAFNQDGVNDYLDGNGNSVSFNNAYDQECRGDFNCRNTLDVFQFNSGGIPSVDFLGSDALLNPNNLAVRQFKWEDVRTTNDETAARLDVDWSNAFGLDFLTSFKAGVRFTENDYKFVERQFDTGSSLYRRTFNSETGLPNAVFVSDFLAQHPGTYTHFNHPNSFNQHGLSGRNDLLSFLVYDDLNNPEATFARYQQAFAGTNNAAPGSFDDNLDFQEDNFRDISESTSAAYLSFEFDFDRLSAVAGVRYTATDIESDTISDGNVRTGKNDYDDILPSVNISYDVSDQTKLRFAAAKVMRRPNYVDLSSAFNISGAVTVADRGAVDLDPYRATQFDLSLEHYFEEGGIVSFAVFYKDVESFLNTTTVCEANPLTISGPQNVSQWRSVCLLDQAGVSQTNVVGADAGLPEETGFNLVGGLRDAGRTGIRVSQLDNGENGTVEGFEFGIQKHFDWLPGFWSGFGASANYTYADSEQPNGNPLLNISKNTYNLQLYWEGDKFQTRLAYNYRDKFLIEEGTKRIEGIGLLGLGSATTNESDPAFDRSAGNSYRDERGQLDFSASYDVNDSYTVVASVTNLAEEPISLVTEIGNTWRWIEADRRFSFGVRGKF